MTRDKSSPGRTPIWVEGRQHPPFAPRAFARAILVFGRESMAGLLGRCSASAAGLSAELAAGHWRIPESRLGRSGRYLPDYRRIAAAVAGTGRLLGRSAAVVLPGAEPAPPRSIFDAAGIDTPALAVDLPPPESASDPSLAAIRLVIGGSGQAEAPLPQAAEAEPAPPPQPAPRRLGPLLAEGAARALGYGLLAMSLPWGALRATLAHLNGEDLRKLEA